jgi:hypothetical protein
VFLAANCVVLYPASQEPLLHKNIQSLRFVCGKRWCYPYHEFYAFGTLKE